MLTGLIETAIRQNLDVQQAVLRVPEARQGIATACTAGLSSLSASAIYLRDQFGAKGVLKWRGARAAAQRAGQPPTGCWIR